MKTYVTTLAAILGATLLVSSLLAASPTVTAIRADGIVQGETAVLRVSVADTDADLEGITFQISGPGISGWQLAGSVFVSGSDSSVALPWAPPATGVYTISVTANDEADNVSVAAQSTFEVYVGRRLIRDITITNGVARMFTESGEILTAETSPAANVVAENGGTMIFWSGGRTILKSGFHAKPGSFFWAAVDHNMNGYPDMEEATDTDGDGMFDAWEVEHGLNPIAHDATVDLDGDGLTNLQEFHQGRDPRVKDNPSIALAVFTPAG
jgi:hypothetical protein